MLKAELHTHINIDPLDYKFVDYSAFQLIDRAAELNFNVLAITCHNYVYDDPAAKEYADKKNILLLFGAEKDVDGKHTLLYNINHEVAQTINTLDDLRRARKEHPEMLVIAAHPFHYYSSCHKKNIIQHPDLFDAWEYSFFYASFFNPNRKTMRLAKAYHKPLVGNSDVHKLKDIGRTYTLIDAAPREEEVFKAIKEGKTKIITTPVPVPELIRITCRAFCVGLRKKWKRRREHPSP
ncbi:PHP domain-containing protein [Candidatus Woesearchaeota archaeon]|nr:PHP domain-containing protein [Candidatus Woesearchaeota archaeon]